MFFALHRDEVVWAKHASDHEAYTCPGCGEGLYLRAQGSSKRQVHFVHYAHSNCAGFGRESEDHLMMKHWYIEQLQEMGADDIAYEKRRYVDAEKWRQPDVAFAWHGKRYAIEVQRTQIPDAIIIDRTRDIIATGIERPFWVISHHWGTGKGLVELFVGGSFRVEKDEVAAPSPLSMLMTASSWFCFWSETSTGFCTNHRSRSCGEDDEFKKERQERLANIAIVGRKAERIARKKYAGLVRRVLFDPGLCTAGSLASSVSDRRICVIFPLEMSTMPAVTGMCIDSMNEFMKGAADACGMSLREIYRLRNLESKYEQASQFLDDLFEWRSWVIRSRTITRAEKIEVVGIIVPIPSTWNRRWPNPLPSFLKMKAIILEAYDRELANATT